MGVGILNLIGRIAPVFKANYAADTAYKKMDVVLYEYSLWLALQDTTGNAPPGIPENADLTQPIKNDYWQLYIPGAQVAGGESFVSKTDIAQAPTETDPGKLGISKPDGETITIDSDGTLHGASLDFVGTAKELKAAIAAGSVRAGMTAFIKDGEIDGDGLLVEVSDGSGMSMIGKVENGEFLPYATMGEKQLGVPLFVFETEEEWQAEYDNGNVPDGSVVIIIEDDSDPVYGTVDSELSETSENPVQNKAVTAGINAVKAMRASETEYGMVELCSLTDVTNSTGKALPVTEKNPAISGTLANKLANLNGAYTVRKLHTQDAVYSAADWTIVPDFSYTVPQKSIVIMTIGFTFSQAATTNLEVFILGSFFATDVYSANVHARFERCATFILERNQKIDVVVGVKPDAAITIYGSSDERIVRADYLVIPLE